MKNENCKMMDKLGRARGFTLVEMLVAMALTLILVYAVAEFYAYVGNAVRDGRATIELGGQLRAASQQLHDDLHSLTLRPTPWIDANASPGYFTIYEFQGYDADPDSAPGNTMATNDLAADTNGNSVPDLVDNNITTLFGDGDDVIAMTIQAKGTPFQGRYNGNVITSQYAEVIWFTTFEDTNGDNDWDIGEPRVLCRRLLLIRPDLTPAGLTQYQYTTLDNSFDFWDSNDLSVRIEEFTDSMGMFLYYAPVTSSLQQLSHRRNRFGCNLSANAPRNQGSVPSPKGYPFTLDLNPNNFAAVNVYNMQGASYGEDRVLSSVLAFDVRVYDPEARIYQATGATGNVAVTVGDPGYVSAAQQETPDPLLPASGMPSWTPAPPMGMPPHQPQYTFPHWRLNQAPYQTPLQGMGAWVDLNYNLALDREPGDKYAYTHFSGYRPSPPSSYVQPPLGLSVWDTWPTQYEFSAGNGTAFDGLDTDGANGVDDVGERQTQPPYPWPLRGIQVRIRVYEPQTRQAKQVTVGADFIAE